MSFRQPKSNRHDEQRAWQAWLSENKFALNSLQLPPSVTLSESHWIDFLQNGHMDWHPESDDGFFFHQLTKEQMSGLLALLEASPEYNSQPMVGWLRHRLAHTNPEQG